MQPLLEENKEEFIAVDESLFCHNYNNEQLWLVGLISTRSKAFRIEAVKRREGNIL